MRLSDAMKPAMDWSEAAMLPARPRTLCGGAALGQVRQAGGLNTADIADAAPVPAPERPNEPENTLRRAAYRQVRRLF